MDIGQRIKQLRDKHHLSQKELAAKIGVVPGAVCNWENGTNGPNPKQRQKIFKAFGINESEFYGGPPLLNNLSQEIIDALQDPIAVKALLVTYKNKQDIKMAIKAILDCIPGMAPQKRQALIALCK